MDTKIKRKKVLFVITQSEFGGAQRFLYNLISQLNQSVYDLKVAIGDTSDKEFVLALKNAGIEVSELKWLTRNINPVKDLGAIFELRKLIKKFEPETVLLNSSKAGFIGSFAATFPSKIKTRVIYRIGGWSFNDPWPWWKKKLWLILEKKSAGWKDLIIVNNRHDLEQARRLKIGETEKILLIHNGLDPYRLNLLDKEEAKIKLFEKAAKISGQVFQATTLVGTIANFYPAKGLAYLLETASQLKDRRDLIFLVIGDGPDKKYLENLIQKKNLKNKVFLLGRLENASQYLSAFDIFLLPSVKEGFPWVVLEAMSAKLPIIATAVGAIPELIEDGQNGLLVEPAHPKQITEKIRWLLENDRLKQELGLQAHQTVLFKFPLDKMVKEIEKIL